MKVLIVGYGSIGKRHAKNLLDIKNIEIVICTNNKEVFQLKNRVKIYSTLEESLHENPDIGIICNATSLHVKTAIRLAQNGCHLFIEKPLADSLKNIKTLLTLVKKRKMITMVGCNMRFHSGIQKMKEIIKNEELGRIFSVRVENGSYLPNWHPWEDYRISYASRKELGGGVVLTQIHEIDYLCWFFGKVSKVFAFTDKLSDLELDVEDYAGILLRFKNNLVAEVHLDYFQRPNFRNCKIIGSKGIAYWDSDNNTVRIYNNKKNKWFTKFIESKYDRNQMYVYEMKYFLNCIKNNKKTMNTVFDALETQKIALAIKKSSKINKTIQMKR